MGPSGIAVNNQNGQSNLYRGGRTRLSEALQLCGKAGLDPTQVVGRYF